MPMHKIELRREDGVLDLFDGATATPPIPAGSEVYLQNISNSEVKVGDLLAMDAFLILGGKDSPDATTTLTVEAGDTAFILTDHRLCVITAVT